VQCGTGRGNPAPPRCLVSARRETLARRDSDDRYDAYGYYRSLSHA
jgi:hypothetical protein